MSFPRTAQRVLTGGGATAVVLVALALPAAAHVTINPKIAEPGGYGAFDVRVPNEEDGADTTKVQLYLPEPDHPVASVSVQPTPGWTIDVTKGKLPKPIKTDDGELTQAVTEITWSGGKITPGQMSSSSPCAGAVAHRHGQALLQGAADLHRHVRQGKRRAVDRDAERRRRAGAPGSVDHAHEVRHSPGGGPRRPRATTAWGRPWACSVWWPACSGSSSVARASVRSGRSTSA